MENQHTGKSLAYTPPAPATITVGTPVELHPRLELDKLGIVRAVHGERASVFWYNDETITTENLSDLLIQGYFVPKPNHPFPVRCSEIPIAVDAIVGIKNSKGWVGLVTKIENNKAEVRWIFLKFSDMKKTRTIFKIDELVVLDYGNDENNDRVRTAILET